MTRLAVLSVLGVLVLALAGCDRVFQLDPRASDAAVPEACPAAFRGRRYAPFEDLLDWRAAEQACEALDPDPLDDVYTHLVVVADGAEILELPRLALDGWAGLVSRTDRVSFEWITDKPAGPIPWGADEPNSVSSPPICGEIDSSKLEIGDTSCRNTMNPYVCECDEWPAIVTRFPP